MVPLGTLIDSRFRLEVQVGSGGMGVVYRATDELTGTVVALKVLTSASSGDEARFGREAEILARVVHPGIVRHVAHGRDRDAGAYLAMEWVPGEDLAARLSRGPLSVRDTLSLGAAVAEALDAALSCGVVHRDVKPANILLRNGDVRTPCVADFGIARALQRSTVVTGTGIIVGTPSYMAPEQAGAARVVGGQVDVFSLACVLHECLAGAVAFGGDSLASVLAKILFSAPSPLPTELRGTEVEAVLARMFDKTPMARPSAREVAADLTRLASRSDAGACTVPVGTVERRMTSLWFARGDGADLSATLALDRVTPSAGPAAPVQAFGVEVFPLADGTLAGRASLPTAHDQARAVVRSALRLKQAHPELTVVVATGRATTLGLLPTDDAIERATGLLRQLIQAPSAVRLDEATAELLTGSWTVERDAVGPYASATTGDGGAAEPTGAGRPPLLGRAKELAFLEASARESQEESTFRAVVVTAPAGLGKTRLFQALAERSLGRGDATVLTAACDAIESAAPFAVAAELLRGRAGANRGAAPEDVVHRVALAFEGTSDPLAHDVAQELTSVLHRTARGAPDPHDETSMETDHAHARSAVARWLAQEARQRPLLLLIENLQWMDGRSGEILASLAKLARSLPVCIIGFARPDVRLHHDDLLRELNAAELRLDPLSRRTSEALVRAMLGNEATEASIASVVERGGGHPHFLEELARAFRRNGPAASHASLEAALEARVLELSHDERRVLRAGSVFGSRFWTSGVAELLVGRVDLDSAIERLVRADVLEERLSRFSEQREFAFRHALVRDVVYAMLPEGDRRAAHAYAARWLESVGEQEPALLAVQWLEGASTDAEKERAIDLVERIVEGATLRDTLRWLDEGEGLLSRCRGEADKRLRLRLVGKRARILLRGDRFRASEVAHEWLRLAEEAGAIPDQVTALATECWLAAGAGDFVSADRFAEAAARLAAGDRALEFEAANARAMLSYYRGDLEENLVVGLSLADLAPATRLPSILHNAADAALRLGRFDEALQLLDRSDASLAPTAKRGPHNDVLRAFIEGLRVRGALPPSTDGRMAGALERAEAQGETWVALEIQLFSAILEAWRGELARARAQLVELAKRASAHGHARLADEVVACVRTIDDGSLPWFRGGTGPAEGRLPSH